MALVHGYFGLENVSNETILSVLIEELRSKDIARASFSFLGVIL